MPYITQDRRDKLDVEIHVLQATLEGMGSEAGDLNYPLSRLVAKALSLLVEYTTLEFYRRAAGPYEDKAARNNGDIEEYING